MKTLFRLLFSLYIILIAPSCNSKKLHSSKEAKIIWNLQNDETKPIRVREGAVVLLDVLEEKENIRIREYFDADRKVSSLQSTATVQAWIALLNSTEKKLSTELPTAEEIDNEEIESNKKNIKFIYYSTAMHLSLINSCLSSLASLDMPEAKEEIKEFLQRFEKKYGASTGGKKMLDLYKMDISQQEEDTRMGLAPWQVGPNPSDGCH